jgi:predicted AAA+ superfamily ATPase
MADLLLVRRLKPWTFNIGKRHVRSPKIYIRDSGITHALLNVGSYNDLLGHPVVGGSWEGFVIENIMSVTPPRVQPFYYGTPGGAEIDLLFEFATNEKWAVEIKRSSSPSLTKGFHIACDDGLFQENNNLFDSRATVTDFIQQGVQISDIQDTFHFSCLF